LTRIDDGEQSMGNGIEIPEHKFRIRIVLFEQQINKESMRNETSNNENK
jgi:hypothetical protein